MSVLMWSCGKDLQHCTLSIRNASGEELWVESNIISAYSDTLMSFSLQDAQDNSVRLATSEWVEQNSQMSLSDCIYNANAYVSIFRLDTLGRKVLLHTWYYTDKEKEGHQLFSEQSLDRQVMCDEMGDASILYLFTLLPEDLVEDDAH